MTDPWETRVDATPPRQGISPAMIAVVATSVAVLAIIGATGGYLLASAKPDVSPTPTVAVSLSASPSPSPKPNPSFSATQQPPNGFLPMGVGTDFREYFRQLRGLKLGVVLTFGEPGEANTVTRTDPVAGSPIRNGGTIKVYVAGDPPPVEVPDVHGVKCREAGRTLSLAGSFTPNYSGLDPDESFVVSMSPDPLTGGTARWNDKISLVCGAAPTPSPSESATTG
jgi:hypothetical protein